MLWRRMATELLHLPHAADTDDFALALACADLLTAKLIEQCLMDKTSHGGERARCLSAFLAEPRLSRLSGRKGIRRGSAPFLQLTSASPSFHHLIWVP